MALDLFPSLATIGKSRDYEWYNKLSEEDQKEAKPVVIARWLTGTKDLQQILNLNEFVNPYVFALASEKELLFKLMTAACTGSTGRYQWIKPPGTAGSKTNMKIEVIAQYYETSLREAALYLRNTKESDIIMMAEELGFDKEQMKLLEKELTNGSGSTTASSTKPKGSTRGKRS